MSPLSAPTKEGKDEQFEVMVRRVAEASEAGFSNAWAWSWAQSDGDVGHLRKLLADGCPIALIARILAPLD